MEGKKKLLIAEDNMSNFKLINFVLSREYEIIHAINGKEAVDMFNAENPDIILMDVGMPVMNGIEATMEIRKISATVPIIGLTAYAYATDEERGIECGMNKYLTKPVNMTLLKDSIKELLG